MSARDNLLDEYGRASSAPLGTLADLREKLDSLRADVLREGAALIEHGACDADWSATLAYCHGMRAAAALLTGAAEANPASTLTVFRASHDSIVMGLYTTAAEARAHCEGEERRSWPTGTSLAFDWIEDDEDGVAELVVAAGQNEESTTGYVVTALEVASKYDEEADE